MERRLEFLKQVSFRGPPDWRLVITTDLSLTSNNVAACDITAKTVYLHPYFFILSDCQQLRILYHELISHFVKGIQYENEALEDTELFISEALLADTYKTLTRAEKERITEEEIKRHWDLRASRPDLFAVMSTKYTMAQNRAASEKLQEDISEFIKDIIKSKCVFELGVGIGRMTSMLATLAREVVGNDISPRMIERARNNLEGLNNVKLHLGKIDELNLPAKYFDMVFACTVLIHILNPDKLRVMIEAMKGLSDKILVVEHIYENESQRTSKYTILRKERE